MQDFKYNSILGLLLAALAFTACKKDVVEEVNYSNVIYQVDTVAVYRNNSEKTRQKTPSQFYSILFSNLYQKSIPSTELSNLSEISTSIGDKKMFNEMIIQAYISDPELKAPTNEEMRQDVEKFVEQTYLRFYLRKPSQIEKYYFTDLINKDPGITPQMVYAAFTQSNEYLFY